MGSVLSHLVNDLHWRGSEALKELEALEKTSSEDLLDRLRKTREHFERIVAQVDFLRSDPTLESPEFAPNTFYLYRRIAQRMTMFEDVELLALRRFTVEDGRVTRLLSQICREIGYAEDPPLCVAISPQYYCAYPEFDLVLMPQAESERLLTIPDLYHEMAHFVHRRFPDQFEGPNRDIVIGYFTRLIAEKEDENWPDDSLTELASYPTQWLRGWLEEFFCDLLATFWCGPAYGFANLRLSANRGSAYSKTRLHPADDARHRAICFMLDLCGNAEAAHLVDQQWQELCILTGDERPQRFELMYPSALMLQLAKSVYATAKAASYVPYSPSVPAESKSVTAKLNIAWQEFFDNPEDLLNSQKETIKSMVS